MVEATSSSSTGLVTAQFLAVFLAASGKTSVQFSESDESDPDSASQEIRNSSIRIIFPTIERVWDKCISVQLSPTQPYGENMAKVEKRKHAS
ncbi:hypothetical protein CsSME_00052792 [Camellia sinensis var. sinensis]